MLQRKFTKIVFKITFAAVLLVFAILSPAQNIPADKGTSWCYQANTKWDEFSAKKFNSASHGFRTCLLGKEGDVIPAENATIRVLNDVLIMRVGYYAPRLLVPESAHLELTSYSTKPFKYENNRKLSIFIDDELLFSKDMELRSSIKVAEKFFISIKYADFLNFTSAKKVRVQFGDIIVELKKEQVKALNDLNESTKHLNYPPNFSPM